MIFAIQDIRAGDEVCIDYLGNQADLPRHMRQHHLLEGWGFNCQCSRCQKEASLDYSAIAIPIGFVCAGLPMLIAINDDWEAVEAALCQGDCWRELPGQVLHARLAALLCGLVSIHCAARHQSNGNRHHVIPRTRVAQAKAIEVPVSLMLITCCLVQRMLEELNELNEPLEENPSTWLVSFSVLVGKALIQVGDGGAFLQHRRSKFAKGPLS